jgi:hypothetical protein
VEVEEVEEVEKWKKWKKWKGASSSLAVPAKSEDDWPRRSLREDTAYACSPGPVRCLACRPMPGNLGYALDATSYVGALREGDTLVHLVGTPHPTPSKAAEFRRVDLLSIEAAVAAAVKSENRSCESVSSVTSVVPGTYADQRMTSAFEP